LPKERILVVDDEKNIVSSLYGILSDEGYDVSSAEDGIEALERIQNDPPDLVLLDIWIPGMDGIEVLKTIKTYQKELPVLIMSGHASIDTAVRATKLGAIDFIEKPFSLDQITQAVSNGLKEGKGITPQNRVDFTDRIDRILRFQMMIDVKKGVKNASKNSRPILLCGEKGTGKELVAQAIHRQSKQNDRPFIKLNCAVRRMQDIQAQLFCSSKKNGISSQNPSGAKEKAVFLSNIESLSKGLQEKLSSALKNQTIKKNETVLDFLPIRVFASSSKNLETLVKKGSLNKELFEVLTKNTIQIPPLRDHREAIPEFLQNYFESWENNGGSKPEIEGEAIAALCNYDWPGNIKELKEVLEQVWLPGTGNKKINLQDLPPPIRLTATSNGKEKIEIKPKGMMQQSLCQRTLKRSVVLCGSGLHSGIKTGLILQPLPAGSGIVFGDITTGETIQAKLNNVQSTNYSTCLQKGLVSIGTIEHIMAVLHMYRITNLLIKIGDEAPVMDGSAKDFCQLIEDGGFEDQGDTYEELVVDKEYTFGDPNSGKPYITIEPSNTFTASYHMEYPEPIGIQDYTYEFLGSESFKIEIAPARTFGFLEDVAQLTKMGFACGGKLDNFILLGDKKVLNTELRFDDEFVRHKILDIIGDFYLLGRPIRGKINAYKSGHTENVGIMKQIQSTLC
jgi:UDP-3-O-acyl N-acetylglucosamine deacetylase